jgi:CubicO group peptidase (beta-lactamase class C family)
VKDAGTRHEAVSGILRSNQLDRSPGALTACASDGAGIVVCFGGPDAAGLVTSSTVMYAASLAKQVIGLLLSQHVESGDLDPEQALSHYVEGLPGWADDVRVRHLVHHTAGLPPVQDLSLTSGNEGVLRSLADSSGPTTRPGATYAYSNVGYVCLAEVLTRVGGQPVEELAQRALFGPLGMASTALARSGPVRTGHAPPPATLGDGGLWTTAEDLLRWNDAMNSERFGHAVHARCETPGTLDDGTPLDYAWGVRVLRLRGRRTLSHGGSWPTWSAKAVRQPEQQTSVAILSASDDADAVTNSALAVIEELAD